MFAMLNAFLGGAERELRAYGGQVDKFIGDAVMAVFREPGPDQALHAVQAALAIKRFLVGFNADRVAAAGLGAAGSGAGGFPIEIGVGISTGRVMQGNIGSERRKDLTVIGDEVNLAARLETASKGGRHSGIILSERTYGLVRHAVDAVEMPVRTVKGKEQVVRMFELVGLKP
jgi:adenylate cyclase